MKNIKFFTNTKEPLTLKAICTLCSKQTNIIAINNSSEIVVWLCKKNSAMQRVEDTVYANIPLAYVNFEDTTKLNNDDYFVSWLCKCFSHTDTYCTTDLTYKNTFQTIINIYNLGGILAVNKYLKQIGHGC